MTIDVITTIVIIQLDLYFTGLCKEEEEALLLLFHLSLLDDMITRFHSSLTIVVRRATIRFYGGLHV